MIPIYNNFKDILNIWIGNLMMYLIKLFRMKVHYKILQDHTNKEEFLLLKMQSISKNGLQMQKNYIYLEILINGMNQVTKL